jgi:hypothetical protein
MYDRDVRRSTEPPAGQAGARQPPVDAITRLQQSAGNRAVAALLDRPKVMRLGTGEHAQLGGNRQVTINGVTMTEGEAITLGDFYLTPARVYEAPKAELEHLVKLIRQDTLYKQGVKGATKVKQGEWEAATSAHKQGETYKQLAFDNDTHYGPDTRSETERRTDYVMTRGPWASVPARKGDHRSEWERYHREATVEARVEALGGTTTVPEKAVVLNAFASHFLTDAFAAGHLHAKSQIMDFARRKWLDLGADETWFDIIPESSFTVAVAEKLLDHPKAGPKLRGYQIRIVQWGDMSVTKLSEMIYGLQDQAPEVFYSMFVGIVHDALNDAIEKDDKAGLPDIMVTNERGDGPWSLPGDGNLAKSPETIRIAKAAVEESYRNLELAVSDPRGFDVEKAVKRVWAYAPRPTPQAALLIGKVIADYADVSEPKTQQAAADYLIDNIDDVIDGLLKRNRIRVPVPQKPMPAPYPRPRISR